MADYDMAGNSLVVESVRVGSSRQGTGSTAIGIYSGSGAPSISATKGSIYLRTDGSSSSTRIYVNSTGSTTWVAVTTAS